MKFLTMISVMTLQLVPCILVQASKTINQDGVQLIKHFEKFRSDFYDDQLGSRTIGYGHACHGDGKNCTGITAPLSKDAATQLLYKDLAPREECVSNAIKREPTSNQFSALVSIVFNMGCEAFKATPIVTRFNQNDLPGTAQAIRSFYTMNGNLLEDLRKRRQVEADLFLRISVSKPRTFSPKLTPSRHPKWVTG